MSARLSIRSAHTRHLKDGTVVNVRECWVLRDHNPTDESRSYRHPCPQCGAAIISVHMPNGGWAYFESERGLRRVKHPCMHVGEAIGGGRDARTPDLFRDESVHANL